MVREMAKVAPRQYLKFGLNLFSWLPKAEKSEPSSQHALVSSESAIVDEEAQQNFDSEIKYMKLPLRILGLWPFDDQSSHLRWLVFFVIFSSYTIPVIVGLALVGKTRLADHQIRYLADSSLNVCGILQFIFFKIKRFKLRFILERIRDNWRESAKHFAEDKKRMLFYSSKTKMIMILYVVSYFIMGSVYFSEPFINGEVSLKKLPTYGIYPFSTDCSPNYEIVSVIQLVQGCFGILSITSMDGFHVMSVLHGCGQLHLLCETIRRYDGKTRHAPSLDNSINKSISSPCSCLKCIVDRHVSVGEYIQMVDDSFNGIVMARLIMTTFHFCGVGYGIVKSNETRNVPDFLTNILYMVMMMINFFVCCWTGQHLLEESENVGSTVYELSWYSINSKVSRSLILPMLRSKKPMKITAGHFFVMTFECFQKWFINSMGYLSVILAIKSQT